MIYPKDVVDFVVNDSALKERFPHIAAIDSVNVLSSAAGSDDFTFEEYMMTEGYTKSRAIRKYLHYLASIYDTFNNIFLYFPKENATSTHKDDVSAIGTAPFELFYHALYLYYLDSWGVEGDVIECGTYKGFSASCLSWVCSYLDKTLIVADSFAGLPENSTDPYYKKGDFCGQLDEVRANIEDFGKIENVEFVKGFYDTSLQGFQRPLCMLWMDVDLYESTMDIMTNVFSSLSKDGVLISHELFADRDFENGLLKPTIGPSKALHAFFTESAVKYQAIPLENGSGLVVPYSGDGNLLLSAKHVQCLRDSCSHSELLVARERVKLEGDIGHWQHELNKLMQIYHGTTDYKLKRTMKVLLSKVGLHKLDAE